MERLCQDVELSQEQKNAAKKWLQLLEDNQLQEEKPNYPKFMRIILQDVLGYSIEEIDFEKDNVEFQFGRDGKNLLCFEVKGTSTEDLFAFQHRSKKEHSTPIKQTWDYMGSIGLEYGICTNYKVFVLITKNFGYSKHHLFNFESIRKNESKLREFVGIFSKNTLIYEGFAEKVSKESITEEREFTNEFYKLFHETRLILIKSFQDKDISKNESIYYAQIFLNRLMFIFFVEDMGFVPDNRMFYNRVLKLLDSGQPTEHSRKVFDDINELFTVFDKGSDILKVFGFNGGLFSGTIPNKVYFNDLKNKYYFQEVWQHSKLLETTKLDEYASGIIKKHKDLNPIISNLLLMDSYDFSTEVSVNILGHIFEQSISDLEELRGGSISTRKKEGIYYTSEHITDYICKNTIVPYLSRSGDITDPHELVNEYVENNDIDTLEKKFKEIKILDPACGSGAFLIKAVDVLLEIHRIIQNHKENTGKYSGLDKWNEESEIRAIIENNIYGVDLNKESVEISRLSLFFKTASTNRKLPNLSKNIKVGNSLISDKTIDPLAFNWTEEFPEIFSELLDERGFAIHIGNPPYVRQESLANKERMQLPEDSSLNLEEFEIPSKTDLSGYFYYQFLDHLKPDGMQGFITTDSWMSYDYGKSLQQVLIDKSRISVLMRTKFNAFTDADVKTVTVILEKTVDPHNIIKLIYADKEGEISSQNAVYIEKSQKELRVGNWNLYFLNNDLQPKIPMVKLSDTGNVKRGKTTGCNDFFVLTSETIKEYGIASKYYKPIISRDIHEGILTNSDATEYLLNVNESKGKLVKTEEGKQVLEYIVKAGENTKVTPKKGKNQTPRMISELSSVKSHKPWWYSLKMGNPPAIFLGRFANEKMKFYENNGNFYARDNFAYFTPNNAENTYAFLAYLSSSWFSLYLEKNGHPAGGGALQFLTRDYKNALIPNFDVIDKENVKNMKKAWCNYREDFDQKKLNSVVLKILGFTAEEIKQVREELEDIRNKRLSSK